MIYNSTPAQKDALKEFNMTLRKVAAEGFMIGVRKGMDNIHRANVASRVARIVHICLFPELARNDTAHKFIEDYPEEFKISKLIADITESGCELNMSEASILCRYICQFLNREDVSVADEIRILLSIYLPSASEEVRVEVTPWMVLHDL